MMDEFSSFYTPHIEENYDPTAALIVAKDLQITSMHVNLRRRQPVSGETLTAIPVQAG